MSIHIDSLLIFTGEGADRQIDLQQLAEDSTVHVTYAVGEGLQESRHVTLSELLEAYHKPIGLPHNIVQDNHMTYKLSQ